MNTKSAFPANTPLNTAVSEPASRKILVWDAPVRVFHWLMVLSFAGAYLSAESERWRLLHVTLGYTMAGLVGFRILWGLMGTRYARFSSFVRGPRAVARYLGAMLRGQPEHHTGHNPAGALAIVALLALTLVVTASGWASYNEIAGKWLEDLHRRALPSPSGPLHRRRSTSLLVLPAEHTRMGQSPPCVSCSPKTTRC